MNTDIRENILILKNEFEKIKKMGWIETVQKGTGGIGRTFEYYLGKEWDNFEIPDFNGIEIKTHNAKSISKISLFNATPDSYLFEIARIKEAYGYPDRECKNLKVFNGDVFANKKEFIGCRYQFQLFIDKEQEMIQMHVYNYSGKLIDTKVGWTFDVLREKLYRKLRILAFVRAEKKYINNKIHYKYQAIAFFILKDFNTFLSLLDQGIININFCIGAFKSGKRKGETHDHGTSFNIFEKDLNLLFDKIN